MYYVALFDDDDEQHLNGAIYLFKKHSKARAPPIKLALKCLKEDFSFLLKL